MNKNLILKRFSKSLKTYNSNAIIQKQMAEQLISFLKNKNFSSILEIGCGTGLLTKLLSDKFMFQQYYANDIVDECQEYIYKINPNIIFTPGDMEKVLYTNIKYDLIISNAALQWVEDFPAFVIKLINLLNKNGILLFSTFGQDNFYEIATILGKKLNYYSVQDIKTIFAEYSPVVQEEKKVMTFKTPKEVLKHIQTTGVNSVEEVTWTKKDLLEFEIAYNNISSNSYHLTYHPIYVFIQI